MASEMCFKVVLGVVCLCHLGIGIAGIVVGGIASQPAYSHALSTASFSFQRMLIGLGVLLVILAILAGVSIFCRSQFPFMTFLVLSFLTALVHIGLGIFILVSGRIDSIYLSSPMANNSPLAPGVMDTLQSSLKCCGMYSIAYYSAWNLPESCCPENTSVCDKSTAHPVGFAGKILAIMNPIYKGLGGFLIILCLVQILVFIVLYVISPTSGEETDT